MKNILNKILSSVCDIETCGKCKLLTPMELGIRTANIDCFGTSYYADFMDKLDYSTTELKFFICCACYCEVKGLNITQYSELSDKARLTNTFRDSLS